MDELYRCTFAHIVAGAANTIHIGMAEIGPAPDAVR
jgi:hypothetical protein